MAYSNTEDFTAAMTPNITTINLSAYQAMLKASQAAADQPPKQGHGILIQSKTNVDENCLSFPKETDCDITSAKHVFGWTTIDGVNLPFIIRSYEKFVSVRMLEAKLLSNYPSNFAMEIDSKLVSHRITFNEQSLLNEINVDHCDYEYGKEPFTGSDIIVQLNKFQDFYQHVKETFPEEVTNSQCLGIHLDSPRNIRLQSHGWLQINNTVAPYVRRQNKKYALLPVLQLAADLMTEGDFPVVIITEVECVKLNLICATSGFDFHFDTSTKLVDIEYIKQLHRVTLLELPIEKPVVNAKYGVTHELIRMSKEFNLDNCLQVRANLPLANRKQVLPNANAASYTCPSLPQVRPLSQQVHSQPHPAQAQQELSTTSHRPQSMQQIQPSPYQGHWQLQQQQQQQQQQHIQHTVDYTEPALRCRRLVQTLQPGRHIFPPHHAMEHGQSPQQMLQIQKMQPTRQVRPHKQPLSWHQPQSWVQESQVHIPEQHVHTHLPPFYQSQPNTHSTLPSTLHQFHQRQNQHTEAMLLERRPDESQLRHQFQIPQHQHHTLQTPQHQPHPLQTPQHQLHPLQTPQYQQHQLHITQHQQHPLQITHHQQHPSQITHDRTVLHQKQQRELILHHKDIRSQARATLQSKQTHTISPLVQNTPTICSLDPIQIPHINTELNSRPEYCQPYRAQILQDRTQSGMSDVQNNPYHSSLPISTILSLDLLSNNKSGMLPQGYQSIPVSSSSRTNSHECTINNIASDNIRLQSITTNSQVQPATCSPHISALKTREHIFTSGNGRHRMPPITTRETRILNAKVISLNTSITGDRETGAPEINGRVSTNDEVSVNGEGNVSSNTCIPVKPHTIKHLLQLDTISNTLDPILSDTIPTTYSPHVSHINVPINNTVVNDFRCLVTNTDTSRHVIIPDASSAAYNKPDLDITITKVENLSDISKMVQCIHLVKFYGKALSCLEHHSRKGKYVLIKAMRNLYFPMINLSLLKFFIEKVFKIPTVKCSSTEERAFNQYYGLSSVDTKCNKMVELSDLKKRFIWLCKFISSKKDTTLSSPCHVNRHCKALTGGINQCVTKLSNAISTTELIASTKPNTFTPKKRKLSVEESDFHCLPEKHTSLQQDSCDLDSSCIKRTPLATIFTERNSQ